MLFFSLSFLFHKKNNLYPIPPAPPQFLLPPGISAQKKGFRGVYLKKKIAAKCIISWIMVRCSRRFVKWLLGIIRNDPDDLALCHTDINFLSYNWMCVLRGRNHFFACFFLSLWRNCIDCTGWCCLCLVKELKGGLMALFIVILIISSFWWKLFKGLYFKSFCSSLAGFSTLPGLKTISNLQRVQETNILNFVSIPPYVWCCEPKYIQNLSSRLCCGVNTNSGRRLFLPF